MTDTFPETVLASERLKLRPYTAADIPDTQAGCEDELTQRWLPLPRPYTLAEAESWCTDLSHSLRTSGVGIHFAVTDAQTGRLLGNIGLNRTDWRGRTSEVGYWVSPWARGRGIAAEATVLVARWLLLDQGFERLELRAAVENIASCKTAVKAGFQREGVLRSGGFVHGGRVDLVMFSQLPGDLAS